MAKRCYAENAIKGLWNQWEEITRKHLHLFVKNVEISLLSTNTTSRKRPVVFLCHKGGDQVKVKVTQDFRDRTTDLVLRKEGEILEVDKARADKLIGMGLAVMHREPSKAKKE